MKRVNGKAKTAQLKGMETQRKSAEKTLSFWLISMQYFCQ